MKKLMLILLVGLGMSFSAQSQNRCVNDTTKECTMDSAKMCQDSIKECSMNVLQKTEVTKITEVNVENIYRYNDDVYYYPYYYGSSWYVRPWYWSYPIIIDRNGHRHKDFTHRSKVYITNNKRYDNKDNKSFDHKDNKPVINQHRNSNVTDNRARNSSSMYVTPQSRGQMRGQIQGKSSAQRKYSVIENKSSAPQTRQQMQTRSPAQQNRQQIQSRPPAQRYTAPPTRKSVRRGPSANIENWMLDDTYLEIN